MLICCAVIVTGWVLLSPASTSPLCDKDSYRQAHSSICNTGSGAPGSVPGSGGDGSGGLLGIVGHVLGGKVL